MALKIAKWSFICIGGYLVLSRATDAGRLLMSGSNAAGGYAKVLQGR